jgi:putative nucleotidyltransferase with HDIG domain
MHAAAQGVQAAEHLGRDRTVIYNAEIAGIVLAAETRRSGDRGDNLSAVLALTEVLDIRDAGTATHSQTVGRYAQWIARGLGLSEELVERVRLAGILHDVGKIAVPDSVLNKPGPLTDEEYDQMKRHPEVGALIVDGADLKDVASWVQAHHERPDGKGYPFGLAGEEIPLEARILSVADSYEAMTVDRVYRRAMPAAAAREELRRCAGTQFDPRVVEVFLQALERQDAGYALDEIVDERSAAEV